MKEMHGKGKMEAAKMHYEALMAALAALGMSLAEFEDQMGGEEPEEGEEYAEASEEGEEMAEKKPIDKAKVAVIVARMKNKMKG
jgi:predicted translin family RNA/ssDNA-binding protein